MASLTNIDRLVFKKQISSAEQNDLIGALNNHPEWHVSYLPDHDLFASYDHYVYCCRKMLKYTLALHCEYAGRRQWLFCYRCSRFSLPTTLAHGICEKGVKNQFCDSEGSSVLSTSNGVVRV